MASHKIIKGEKEDSKNFFAPSLSDVSLHHKRKTGTLVD